MRLPISRGARLAAISASVGRAAASRARGDLVEREPRVAVGRRGVRQAREAGPRLAELVAVGARLGRRRLRVAALDVGLGRRIVAIVAPDRFVADQAVDHGKGGREVLELDVGHRTRRSVPARPWGSAPGSGDRHRAPRRVGASRAAHRRRPARHRRAGAVGAEGVALLHRLLHAHAIAQRDQAIETKAPAQRLVVRRQRGQQRVDSRKRRIGAVEAPGRIGPDPAPQRTIAPACCAAIGRVGAGDRRGAEGRAHVEQNVGRLVAHALIAARQPHRLAIGF